MNIFEFLQRVAEFDDWRIEDGSGNIRRGRAAGFKEEKDVNKETL